MKVAVTLSFNTYAEGSRRIWTTKFLYITHSGTYYTTIYFRIVANVDKQYLKYLILKMLVVTLLNLRPTNV